MTSGADTGMGVEYDFRPIVIRISAVIVVTVITIAGLSTWVAVGIKAVNRNQIMRRHG